MSVISKKRFYNVLFATVLALVFFLIITNKNVLVKTNRMFTYVNISRQIDASINCFKDIKGSLPDIFTIRPDWKKSLYFLEVSCRSSKNGRISILPRQACAIESAAFTNPNSDVHVLYASSGLVENLGSLSDSLLEVLLSYKNIQLLHVDIENMVNRSIVKSLYDQNKVQSAAYPMIVTSDILRLLILQNYGDTYLDLDVIVLKELDKLPLNCAGLESTIYVNNAVMRVANDSVGKHFTQLCLEDLKNHFLGTAWAFTGPAVVTKTLKNMCGVNDLSLMPKTDCLGFKVFPVDAFYPVQWDGWLKYFDAQTSDDLINHILNSSYVIHVWNKLSATFNASEVPNSIYNTLAEKFCPRVYKVANKYF